MFNASQGGFRNKGTSYGGPSYGFYKPSQGTPLPYNPETDPFVSVQSGDWDDSSTWNVWSQETGLLYASQYYPGQLGEQNDAYIQAAHTVTCTKDERVKDLWLNATQDVQRINTSVYKLSVYGTMHSYDGTYSSPTFSASSAGIPAWINGRFRFTGSVSRTIFGVGQTLSANSRCAGWIFEVDFPAGQVATVNTSTFRCGFLLLTSGELNIQPYNSTSNEIRVAGIDYSAQPGDGVHVGDVYILSGTKMVLNGRLVKNNPTSAANGLGNFILQAGGIFVPTLAVMTLPLNKTYNLYGEVWLNQLYNQTFLGKGSNVDSVTLSEYYTVRLGGSGSKSLTNDITINELLSMQEAAATLSLGAFTLSYATNADLQIEQSRTRGSELPALGSGSQIPRNLIIPTGVMYDLGGLVVNIRGILTGGGSVTNGTLNQNQP